MKKLAIAIVIVSNVVFIRCYNLAMKGRHTQDYIQQQKFRHYAWDYWMIALLTMLLWDKKADCETKWFVSSGIVFTVGMALYQSRDYLDRPYVLNWMVNPISSFIAYACWVLVLYFIFCIRTGTFGKK